MNPNLGNPNPTARNTADNARSSYGIPFARANTAPPPNYNTPNNSNPQPIPTPPNTAVPPASTNPTPNPTTNGFDQAYTQVPPRPTSSEFNPTTSGIDPAYTPVPPHEGSRPEDEARNETPQTSHINRSVNECSRAKRSTRIYIC